jgi:hypothetical protein
MNDLTRRTGRTGHNRRWAHGAACSTLIAMMQIADLGEAIIYAIFMEVGGSIHDREV